MFIVLNNMAFDQTMLEHVARQTVNLYRMETKHIDFKQIENLFNIWVNLTEYTGLYIIWLTPMSHPTCNTQFRICAPRQKQPQRFSPLKSYKIHISPLDFWFSTTCPVILTMSNEHGNAQTKPHKANQNIK